MGRDVKAQLSQPFVQVLLLEAYNNGDQGTKETCNWAREVIGEALQ